MLQAIKDALLRTFGAPAAPAYVLIRPDDARRCPHCSAGYSPSDRYCPRCHTLTPEWRFG